MIEMYVLNELASFAKYGTLTAVADKLNVSQPALSRSMKKLEDDLGVVLFERSKNKISLNENGKNAAVLAKKVVDAEIDFEAKIVEYEMKHRIFRFGSIAPIPITELSPILSQVFMGMTIKSELLESGKELYKKLESGEFKMIVMNEPPKDTEKYSSSRLFDEKLCVLLPKTHKLAQKESLSLKELSGEKFLIHRKIGFWYKTTKSLIPKSEFFDQNDLDSLRELVGLADIPAFVTNYSGRTFKIPEKRIAIPLTDPEVNVTFYCVCLKRHEDQFKALFSQIKGIYGNN